MSRNCPSARCATSPIDALLPRASWICRGQSLTRCVQLQCFLQYVPQTGCSLQDYACQCTTANADKIRDPVTQCVMKSCPNTADQLKVNQVSTSICAKYNPSMASSSAAPSAGPSGSPSSGAANTTASAGGGGAGGGTPTMSTTQASLSGPQATAFTGGADPAAAIKGTYIGGGILAGLFGLLVA